MKNATYAVLAFALILITTSCKFNAVKLQEFKPGTEVPVQGSLSFKFNKDLAPPEKQDKWLNDEFVKFKPRIIGKFKWVSAKELVFSPDAALLPSQDYEAEISSIVLFGEKLSTSFDKIDFHTPYFKIEKTDFYWTSIPKSNYKVSVQANLHFNYPVHPSELRKFIEITKDSKPVTEYSILSSSPSDVITLNFGEAQQSDKPQNYSIKINKGLNSILKKKPLQDDYVINNQLAPITELTIQYVTSGYEGDKGWIEVGTSQMVDKDFVQKYISTSPEKELSFVVTPSNFRIEGNFNPNDMVDINIAKGLPGLYGGTLANDYEETVPMANLEASLSWKDDGRYMMLSGFKNLEINAVNTPDAELVVYKIYQNNLLFFLNNSSYLQYQYDYDYDEEYGDGEIGSDVDYGSYDNEYGQELYKDKLKLNSQENRLQTFKINLKKALGGKYQGIYALKINSSEDRWRSVSKFIAISDLGLICKRSDNDLMVWVNSIATTSSVEGVNVKLISSNNQVLMQTTTDAQGRAKFENAARNMGDFKLRLLTAEKAGDFNYLDLRESFIENSRFDVGGKQLPQSGYNAFIYAERNLYRPGEEMHLSAILRSNEMKALTDMPVIVKMIAPNGKSIQEWKKNTNQEGSFEWPFSIPQYATTGQYVAEIHSADDKLIGSYRFNIEEFAPDKIRIALNAGNKKLGKGGIWNMSVSAQYLFGAPASKSRYENDIYFSHKPFTSLRYPDYNFSGSETEGTYLENQVENGFLDDAGKRKISWKVPANLQSNGIIKATDLVSVFDETGRSVSHSESFDIFTKNYFIGVSSNDYYFNTGSDFPVKIAGVNQNDQNLKNFPIEVELIRYEWRNVLTRNYSNRYYYNPQKHEIQQWAKQYSLNGNMTLPIRVMVNGNYELRVRKLGDSGYVSFNFYAYGGAFNNSSSYAVDKEGNIKIIADKTTYKPGEKAKILFSTPFSGKMLVTVERDKIFYNTYIDVKNNSAELELPVTADYKPNVYISATLFKKHQSTQTTPLLVAHGWSNILIEQPDDHLNVKIQAPGKIKPNTIQNIVINTVPGKRVFITLAAIDEGILQIKNFKTPDPYADMYAKRQLDVQSYDLYKFLLAEVPMESSSTGGDEAFEMNKKRSTPFTSQRIKLLSYWSGIRQSDASGKLVLKLPIPQFNGEVRLMAVAYSGEQFGSAEEHITVTDDVILLPSVPRFLSQNDTLNIPVTVVNTTNESGKVNVKINLQGPINSVSKNNVSVDLGPKGQKQVMFKVNTDLRVGLGKISFTTTGLASVKEEMEIAVRPNSPFIQDASAGVIRAGQKINIQLPAGYVNGTQKYTFTVSKFPAIQHTRALKRLLGYPYGCLEQTVAKAFPLLYFGEVAKAAAPELYQKSNPIFFVNEAIRKIESMQLYNGSLTYWPGGNYSNYWADVFAAHFLIEAKKAGFNINSKKLDLLLNYIHQKATEKEMYNYAYYSKGQLVFTKKALKENIYTLYVLAMNGRPDISLMNYYRARPGIITRDMQYMLAAAYGMARDWQSFNSLVPKTFEAENASRLSGGNFDSEIRSNAIMLNVLMDADPNNAQIPLLVKYLVSQADDMYSTQDLSWSFLSLGKAAKVNNNSNVNVKVLSGQESLLSFTGNTVTIQSTSIGNKPITVNSSGNGQVYYFWSAEGVKLDSPVKEEDVNIKIRRNWFDRNGREIKNNTVKQGQLIICKISLTGGTRNIDNVAVSDLIPAGFEILNPRTTSMSEISWLTNHSDPDFMDIRDDRVLFFTNVNARLTQEFYYMLRAVNLGTFSQPAIGAEAMYDPSCRSYNGAEKISVIKEDNGV
jgi:uncharacterized protein YfaS (alpha-2-macroglobulin family)